MVHFLGLRPRYHQEGLQDRAPTFLDTAPLQRQSGKLRPKLGNFTPESLENPMLTGLDIANGRGWFLGI